MISPLTTIELNRITDPDIARIHATTRMMQEQNARSVIASEVLRVVLHKLHQTRKEEVVAILLHADMKRCMDLIADGHTRYCDGFFYLDGVLLIFSSDIGPTDFAFISKEQAFTVRG